MFGQGSGRIRTTDFFGIVLPGFFLVLQISLLAVLAQHPKQSLHWIATSLGNLWAPSLVLVLFVSYLIGSIFRTWAIEDTDGLCRTLFPASAEDPKEETNFPYRERLRRGKDVVCASLSLQELKSVTDLRQEGETEEHALLRYLPPFGLARSVDAQKAEWRFSPPSHFLHDDEPWFDAVKSSRIGERIYNYWKGRLCVGSQSGFEYGEASEARTRFFFGMLWAARWSLRLMLLTALALWIRAGLVAWSAKSSTTLGSPSYQRISIVVFFVVGTFAAELLRPVRASGGWKWLRNTRAGRWAIDERRARRAFFAPFLVEIGLTPVLCCWIQSSADLIRNIGLFVVILFMGTWSAALFVFLASRFRRVRAREMRAVYLNYVAMVLESYRVSKSGAGGGTGNGSAKGQ